MTARLPIDPPPVKTSPLRLLKWAAGLALGAVAAWLLWQWANDMSGVRREAPKVPTIIPLPPPPPTTAGETQGAGTPGRGEGGRARADPGTRRGQARGRGTAVAGR